MRGAFHSVAIMHFSRYQTLEKDLFKRRPSPFSALEAILAQPQLYLRAGKCWFSARIPELWAPLHIREQSQGQGEMFSVQWQGSGPLIDLVRT